MMPPTLAPPSAASHSQADLQVFYLSVILPAYGAAGGAAAAASWGPAAAGLALCTGLALALQAGWLPRSCWEVWDAPAWTATLLFMLEPLAALVRCAAGGMCCCQMKRMAPSC